MKVLLTGGAGFIGSFVAEEYLKNDYELIIIDDFSTGTTENLKAVINHPKLKIYEKDICSKDVHDIIKEHRPNIINHHAAQKSVPFSVENPVLDADKNIMGLLNILEACRAYPIENFIFSSTGGALTDKEEPAKEKDPVFFGSPYAISKYCGEQYIAFYGDLPGFSYSILRYGNVYGPRQTSQGECGVIPIFVENILEGKPSFLFAYEDMPKGCVRDYIFVKDVAHANLLVSENPVNSVINISYGEGFLIQDIYEIIAAAFESSQELIKKGPRKNDARYSILSNVRAKELLNWTPSTTLEEGVKELRQFYDFLK